MAFKDLPIETRSLIGKSAAWLALITLFIIQPLFILLFGGIWLIFYIAKQINKYKENL